MANDQTVVACLGETMALLTPPGELRSHPVLNVHQAGAEGNVAAGLAHLGCRARWISRLGDDEFAPVITDFLRSRGVDVDHVTTDPARPTGLMVKTIRDGKTRVRYARTGSAASALSVADLTPDARRDVGWWHLTGITPALSSSTAELADELIIRRRMAPTIISFDVNHRPVLWGGRSAETELKRLAAAADLVFVGLDEAQDLWGCTTAESVRSLLPGPARLVVKDGAVAAHAFRRSSDGTDAVASVPALRADVVEVVGAGDAFAAGFLSGLVSGTDDRTALRLGHALAACTLQSSRDLPDWPVSTELWGWAALPDDDWNALHVTSSVLMPPTDATRAGPIAATEKS